MTGSRAVPMGRLAVLAAVILVPVLVARGSHDDKLLASQVLVLAAAALCAARMPGAAAPVLVPVAAWAAAPLVAAGVAAARHGGTIAAGGELARHVVFLLAFLAAATALRRGDLRRISWIWVATLAFVAGYAFVQKAGRDPVEEFRKFHSESRPFSTFGNPDFLGVHLAFLLPLLFPLATGARRPAARAALWIACAAAALALFWSGSRGAWLGAVAGLAALFALSGPPRGWRDALRSARVAWALVAVAGIVAVLLLPGIHRAATRRTDRIPLWQGTLAMVRAKPLTGWGPGSFASEYPPFAPAEFAARMKADNTFAEHPHCEYLHVATECGIPALGIFIWLLAAVLRTAVREARRNPLAAGAVGGLAAVLVHVLVDRNFRLASTAVPFWILAGAVFALRARPAAAAPPAGARVWIPAALALVLAAVSLRPLTAALRVEAEADFLAQRPDIPAAELEAGAAAHASDPAYFVALGNAWAREKDFPKAILAFQTAVRLDPGNAGAALNLGNCLFMMSRFPEAAEVYRGLLARDPAHRDARFNLAMTYYYQRRVKDALAEVEIILRREPANAKALQLKRQLSP